SRLRNRIELLESILTDPAVSCSRDEDWTIRVGLAGAFCEIADQVGPIARESGNFRRAALQRNASGIVNGERSSTHESRDAVHLPALDQLALPAFGIFAERKIPLITHHETMTRVEHRTAAFLAKVEGILRQIIFARGAL